MQIPPSAKRDQIRRAPANSRAPKLRNRSPFTPEESLRLAKRSTTRGIILCVVDVAILVSLLAGALLVSVWWLQLLFGAAAGIMIGVLFVVGHDAAHNSLTDSMRLNYVLGQIALMPALHPFSFWVKVHNQTHHRWTNLSPIDYVWTPLSLENYSRLTPFAKLAYRFYRSVWGPLGYYLIEFWWRRIFLPSKNEVGSYNRNQKFDTAIVLVAGTLYTTLLAIGSSLDWFGVDRAWWNPLIFGLVVPFLIWNTLMAFVIYLHHTHPKLTWYDDMDEWVQDSSQLESSVHVIFPGPINRFFHWIMEHNAHHVRPGIPLYRLSEAQQLLEDRAREKVIVFRWSIAGHLDVVRRCKLYDYRARRWMNFAGEYTS